MSKFIPILCLMTALFGCSLLHENTNKPLGYFDRIHVSGPLDVYLQDVGNQPQILNSSFPAVVKNHTLFINSGFSSANTRTPLTIPVRELHELHLSQGAHLMSHHLTFLAPHFRLHDETEGNLMLGGTINTIEINKTRSGVLDVQWFTGKQLSVSGSGNVVIRLAGHVHQLKAILTGHAVLDAQHLNADNAWIKTTENSTAVLNVRQSLSAFASGQSTIHYDNRPDFLSRYPSEQAEIASTAHAAHSPVLVSFE